MKWLLVCSFYELAKYVTMHTSYIIMSYDIRRIPNIMNEKNISNFMDQNILHLRDNIYILKYHFTKFNTLGKNSNVYIGES